MQVADKMSLESSLKPSPVGVAVNQNGPDVSAIGSGSGGHGARLVEARRGADVGVGVGVGNEVVASVVASGTTTIALASVTDWAGFSRAVRVLRAEGAAAEAVRWRVGDGGAADLFDLATGEVRDAHALPEAPALRLPKSFVEAARNVFLNADDSRLPLLHRMVLRIADDTRAWDDPLHLDRLHFDRLLREVRHEIHKMHAFVRFRQIDAPLPDDAAVTAVAADGTAGLSPGTTRHVAWFEPTHHILEAAAPFFARRFATMRWAILTPRVCVEWDGRSLAFRAGASRAQAPGADAGEALWLAYYRSIFNPARVKVAMMKKEMPVRFWRNLPEASAIGQLLIDAPAREQVMIDAGGAWRERRRGRIDLQRASGELPGDGGRDVDSMAGGSESSARRAVGGRVAVDATATSLDTLRRLAARCRDCPVADVATQTVFGEGDASARLMIVGEQPGDQEDLRGRPFQGPAGQLLRSAIGELGWDERALYLTNAVKHFHHELRGKRRLHKTPGQQEAMACLHWLKAEIGALRPRAIVALGATAARSLLGVDVGVVANEGQWFESEDGIPVLICLHPAAILRADVARQPALRERWIASLREAERFLGAAPEPIAESASVSEGDSEPTFESSSEAAAEAASRHASERSFEPRVGPASELAVDRPDHAIESTPAFAIDPASDPALAPADR